MPRTKPAHYRGSYHVDSKRVRDRANADPTTRCRRCGLTLAEIRKVKPRAKWTAGHVVDGQPGGVLRPECSPCNYRAGQALAMARKRHRREQRKRTPRTW